MDNNLSHFLTELYEDGQRNDRQEQERRKKMLNLEPDTARLISMLVRSSQRTRLLEIGTSNGYSTIWLAWAAQGNQGRIVSIDRDEQKQTLADTNLRKANVRDMVALMCGDATEIIAGLPGPFDFVFFDADRTSAPAQLKLLLPKLTPNVFILADNVFSHPDEIAGYLSALETLPQFERIIVPVGKGLSIAYRDGSSPLQG